MKSQTSAATWWSSWMTVPVCLTVSIIATSTLVMLWMATGSSMSTPITEADSTSWELESTGDTATGVQPVPLLAPSRESLNFSHGAKCCCKYLKVFIKDVEFFRLSCVSFYISWRTQSQEGCYTTMVESTTNTLCSTDSLCLFVCLFLVFVIAMLMCSALIPPWPLIVLYGLFTSFC